MEILEDLIDKAQINSNSLSIDDIINFDLDEPEYNDIMLELSNNNIMITEDDKEAGKKLIEANLRLAVKYARRYAESEAQFLDLIQEGNIALMDALEKFDVEKGFKFSTYATWWIKRSIFRFKAKDRAVEIPGHLIEAYYKVNRFTSTFAASYGRTPTIKEISEGTKISEVTAMRIQKIMNLSVSLDAPLIDNSRGHEVLLKDYIGDQYSLEDDVEIRIMFENLDKDMKKILKPRYYEIMRLIYGIGIPRPLKRIEIAKIYGISSERVRQIEYVSLCQMRQFYNINSEKEEYNYTKILK